MNDSSRHFTVQTLAAHWEVSPSHIYNLIRSKPLQSIKIAFARLCKACGIKASPHVLRHTAATWLVMDGVPLAEVARLLGDSEKTVEKVYGKHAPDYLRRAVNALKLIKVPSP